MSGKSTLHFTDSRQQVAQALRMIYTAPTEAAAQAELNRFEGEWGKKYPLVVSSWRANWSELATFFGFAPELRRVIYTTNMIAYTACCVLRAITGSYGR